MANGVPFECAPDALSGRKAARAGIGDDCMAEKTDGRHEGHILAKLNAGKIFADILKVQFSSIEQRQQARRRVARALGLYPKEDLRKLTEEIDRLQGELERTLREREAD
jgi:hypothetical protein